MKYTLQAVTACLVGALASVASAVELSKWETLVPGEEEEAKNSANELINQMKNDYVSKGKRVFRDAHPRGIGCVAAKFVVDPNLASQYRTGVFSEPGKSYDAIIRFSSSLGPVGDNQKDARGMAIKVLGVAGKKLMADQPDATSHDFLQINTPTFPTKNAHDFAGIVSLKTDPKNIVKFLLESPIVHALELKALLEATQNNPQAGRSLLATQFFSQVPYLFKSSSLTSPVKFTSRPCTAVSTQYLDGSEGELRNDLQTRLQQKDACFEFAYQFYKEGQGFDVENGMSLWQENKAPFVKFATITIPKQTFLTDEKLHYCDNLSFQPWHAVDSHRPIGNLNRTRKIVYEMISKFRHDQNQEARNFAEPTDLSAWNSLNSSTFSTWNSVTIPAGSK